VHKKQLLTQGSAQVTDPQILDWDVGNTGVPFSQGGPVGVNWFLTQ